MDARGSARQLRDQQAREGDGHPPPRHKGEDESELAEIFARLEHAERPVLREGAATCCYAKSEKSWVEDPQGVQWETFLTTGESTVYGSEAIEGASAKSCCQPSKAA